MKKIFKLCTSVLIMIIFITACSQENVPAEKACDLGNAQSCYILGMSYSEEGVKQDYTKAKTYFEKACNLDDVGGCFNLGILYNNGQGVEQNYQQAKTYFEKACNLDDGAGCSNLGVLYNNGQGVEQNYQQAKTYYEKACNLNDGGGCFNLGILYKIGQGVTQDYIQARSYFEKSCNLGDALGCYNLGWLYHNGQGVRQNTKNAKELFGKACDMGEQKGCDAYKEFNLSNLIKKHTEASNFNAVYSNPEIFIDNNIKENVPALVNIWGSWCVPCRNEHKIVTELAEKHKIKILGLNLRDKPEDSEKFLRKYGNPYFKVINDFDGMVTSNLRITGVPETIIINKNGKITYRHTGEIKKEDIPEIIEEFKEASK